MRADAIDLDLDGVRVRVLSDDLGVADWLRSTLSEHVVHEPAPLGFALRAPSEAGGLHVLLDRSGYVFARARSAEGLLSPLGGLLTGLLRPAPGVVRVRARALLRSDGGAALAVFPLFLRDPVIERQLERANLRVIDRVAVDVVADRLVAATEPWRDFARMAALAAHTPSLSDPVPISVVLVQEDQTVDPSPAKLVARLAAATCSGPTHGDRLRTAEYLASRQVAVVPYADRTRQIDALRH